MTLYIPMLAMMLLTVIVLLMLASSRYKASKSGTIKMKDIALSGEAWPDSVKKISNNYDNLFQVPVLFYVLCFMALNIEYNASWFLISAWLFVAFRVLHTYIHVTSNHVSRRFMAFLASITALLVMFVGLALQLFNA